MSKYYAVKAGKTPGIYKTWNECQKQTKGFSGAVFKSFKTEKEAKEYIKPALITIKNHSIKVDIYTDGSHKPTVGYLGIGAYCLFKEEEYELSMTCDKEYLEDYGITDKVSNPTAEFLGFAEVLKTFMDYDLDEKILLIFYIDYDGVKNWMEGSWKTKEIYIKTIKEKCDKMLNEMLCTVRIIHVEGHSNNEGNDRADELAKSTKIHSNFDILGNILAEILN